MKIAIFSDCYLDLTGGIVSSINAQKKALEDAGHEVYVFTSGYRRTATELERLARDHIYIVPSCRWLLKGVTPVARRPGVIEKWLLREHPELRDFDIFYVHYEAGCSIAGLRLARRLGIPSLQVMHGREDMGVAALIPWGLRTMVASLLCFAHSLYIPHAIRVSQDNYLAGNVAKAKMWTLMVNHANYADYAMTPSKHFRAKLEHYGLKRKCFVLPNGYPDDKMPAEVATKTLKPGETLRIIWHSRVSGEKRIMVLLRALTLVSGKIRLDVYGGGGDLERAKHYVAKHGLNVKFYGDSSYDTVQRAIHSAHLDALVSYQYDTFGNTLIEAEAHGVPVLFCDPDMREVVPKGGYVLSRNEAAEGIAEAINGILQHPERIAEMSQVMVAHRNEVMVSERIKELEGILTEIKNEI